ncbi:MAG: hypothetical protein KAJ75_04510 [Alphaproteobacteria bacterium]|nr:hypothetical protein [Alphaproteobacteria bacterium]
MYNRRNDRMIHHQRKDELQKIYDLSQELRELADKATIAKKRYEHFEPKQEVLNAVWKMRQLIMAGTTPNNALFASAEESEIPIETLYKEFVKNSNVEYMQKIYARRLAVKYLHDCGFSVTQIKREAGQLGNDNDLIALGVQPRTKAIIAGKDLPKEIVVYDDDLTLVNTFEK